LLDELASAQILDHLPPILRSRPDSRQSTVKAVNEAPAFSLLSCWVIFFSVALDRRLVCR
jgi:hypothetical protein